MKKRDLAKLIDVLAKIGCSKDTLVKNIKDKDQDDKRKLVGAGVMAGSLGIGAPYTYGRTKAAANALAGNINSAVAALQAQSSKGEYLSDRQILQNIPKDLRSRVKLVRTPDGIHAAFKDSIVTSRYSPSAYANQLFAGNSFVVPGQKFAVVGIPPQVHPGTAFHEIGHIKDVFANKITDASVLERSREKAMSGWRSKKRFVRDVLRNEHGAWRNVPKGMKAGIKRAGTGSYKNLFRFNRNMKLAGLGLAAMGAGTLLGSYLMRNKKKKGNSMNTNKAIDALTLIKCDKAMLRKVSIKKQESKVFPKNLWNAFDSLEGRVHSLYGKEQDGIKPSRRVLDALWTERNKLVSLYDGLSDELKYSKSGKEAAGMIRSIDEIYGEMNYV